MANMHAVFAGHMVCYAVEVSGEQGEGSRRIREGGRADNGAAGGGFRPAWRR